MNLKNKKNEKENENEKVDLIKESNKKVIEDKDKLLN